MAKILAVTTSGTNDQTKCTFAFITAVGAIGNGDEAGIALIGEAAYVAKEGIARTIHGVGFPPLSELIDKVIQGNVPVYV
jgi:predicted peroxiredoxin